MRLGLLFFVFIPFLAYSQGNPDKLQDVIPQNEKPALITDRPDQTESSLTVPKNTLQIETGFIYENFRQNTYEFKNWGMGTTLLRYGLWDNFELRLGGYYQRSQLINKNTDMDSVQSGLGPLSTGFKVFIVEEKGLRPQLAFMADLTLNDMGKSDYRPSYTYSTFRFSASHTLSERFSLGYNFGYANNGEDAAGFFVYTVAVGMAICERLGAYAEVYGTSANGDKPYFRYDGGLTYLLRDNLQIDLSAGSGIDKDVDFYFLSFGFSWRIPN